MLYNLFGVREAMESGTPPQRAWLIIFVIFSIISVGAGFTCFFIPFNINLGLFAGIMAGSIWAIIVLFLERTLMKGEGVGAAFLRFIIAMFISGITSFALGLGMQDQQIKTYIEEETSDINTEQYDELNESVAEIETKIDELSERSINLAIEQPENVNAQNVLTQRIKELESKRNLMRAEREDMITWRESDFSLGKKASVYFSMVSGGIYEAIWWWFVFSIEILPSIIGGLYKIVYRD